MKIHRTQLLAIVLKSIFEMDNDSLARLASNVTNEGIENLKDTEQEDIFEAPLELVDVFFTEPVSVPLGEALAATQMVLDIKSNMERATNRIDTNVHPFDIHQVKIPGSDSNLYAINVLVEWCNNTKFSNEDVVFNLNPTWIGEIKCNQMWRAINALITEPPCRFDLAEMIVSEKLKALSEVERLSILSSLKSMNYLGDDALMVYELLEDYFPLHMSWLTPSRNHNQGELITPITLVNEWYLNFKAGISLDASALKLALEAGYSVHVSSDDDQPSYAYCIEGDYSKEYPTEMAAWIAAIKDLESTSVQSKL